LITESGQNKAAVCEEEATRRALYLRNRANCNRFRGNPPQRCPFGLGRSRATIDTAPIEMVQAAGGTWIPLWLAAGPVSPGRADHFLSISRSCGYRAPT